MSPVIVHESTMPVQRRPRRALTVVTAAAVTGLAWQAGRLANVDFIVDTPVGSHKITLVLVVVATVVAGSAAWAVCALVERRAAHPRRVWLTLTATVLAVSIAPIFLLSADLASRLALTGLHCIASAVLVVGLPQRHNAARGA